MIVLHDPSASGDFSRVWALAASDETLSHLDYVAIVQHTEPAWIGQVVTPNVNLAAFGDWLDPAILEGLSRSREQPGVTAAAAVQIHEVQLLGRLNGEELVMARHRPLPGATVTPIAAEHVAHYLGLPPFECYGDGSTNAIGEILAARGVPLCITRDIFRSHVAVLASTGAGKSNVVTNLVAQAAHTGSCVVVHDAKPDYTFIGWSNTDPAVASRWDAFSRYRLRPHGLRDVTRIGFAGSCDAALVDVVVGCAASDFSAEQLAGIFFTGQTPADINAYEALASVAAMLSQREDTYTLDDVLNEVKRRGSLDARDIDAINPSTAANVRSKVARRRSSLPWLDAVGRPAGHGRSASDTRRVAGLLPIDQYLRPGATLVIDYGQIDDGVYAMMLQLMLRVCHTFRRAMSSTGIVQVVDEAHRVFDNQSRHRDMMASAISRVMREGRSMDHAVVLSMQNASQLPSTILNLCNSRIVMRQASLRESQIATDSMTDGSAQQALGLATGEALVQLLGSRGTVLARMAPSPAELMRVDNAGIPASAQAASPASNPRRNGHSPHILPPLTALDEEDEPSWWSR